MKTLPLAISLFLFWVAPAHALTEKDLVARYCAGMITEFYNPDGTRTDCISDTHAIEVDFSDKWAESIGQALHYSLWTVEFTENPDAYPRWHRQVPSARAPGVILLCREDRRLEICANHAVRPRRIAEQFKIPLAIWLCNPDTDMTLETCQRIDQ
ncbi:MAG: hypothetical protein EOS22_04685 [Mesorhizobium sp.]|uniref:hypothetical protein n=1 Tax=Mesorhizobium sp. TaxID=1871066 RepID=UPI000FE541EA|nr:hypothetical protein [Mesorhizobium sp.]RWD31323.1 MAG: hypothetical protein EOS22_04685 [Mesorhizobium sp.]TJW70763.1 MAG: hypothetical protein E5V29_03380 [Mesorhizobium sp.]